MDDPVASTAPQLGAVFMGLRDKVGIDKHIVSTNANGSKAEEIRNRLVLVHGKQVFLAILCQFSDEDGILGGWGLSCMSYTPKLSADA